MVGALLERAGKLTLTPPIGVINRILWVPRLFSSSVGGGVFGNLITG